MPWNVKYLVELDAVLTVYSGVIPAADLQDAILAALTLSRERGTKKFLTDCSTLEGGHSLSDLYNMINMLDEIGVGPGIREAIIVPQLKAAIEDVRFWETACRNRGLDVTIFGTIDEARAWLGVKLSD